MSFEFRVPYSSKLELLSEQVLRHMVTPRMLLVPAVPTRMAGLAVRNHGSGTVCLSKAFLEAGSLVCAAGLVLPAGVAPARASSAHISIPAQIKSPPASLAPQLLGLPAASQLCMSSTTLQSQHVPLCHNLLLLNNSPILYFQLRYSVLFWKNPHLG